MLAERPSYLEAAHADPLPAHRASLRHLHAAMMAAVQSGDGLAGLAKLAHEVARAPIAIVVPGVGCAVEPAAMASPRERDNLERRVRALISQPGDTELDGLHSGVPVLRGGETVGLVGLLDDGVDQALGQLTDPSLHQLTQDGPAEFTHWVLDVTAAAVLAALIVEETRMDTEHRLRGSFLEQLRAGDSLTGTEVARRAARLGCDVSGGAVMLCVEIEGTRPRSVALGIADEHPGAFAQAIEPADGHTQVWAILPPLRDAGDDVAQATLEAARRLASGLRQHGAVGLSRFHADPAEFSLGLDEAELMLDVMRKAAVAPGGEIVEGTYKLLFRLLASHPDELTSFHATTIAPLVAHDAQYRTDLVRTLEVYLDTNCNMNVTADTIFAHRHTVAHRLERVCELTRLDPTVHEHRERLGLGLKIHRLTA